MRCKETEWRYDNFIDKASRFCSPKTLHEGWMASINRISHLPCLIPSEILQKITFYTVASRVDSSTKDRVGDRIVIYQADQVILRKSISLNPTMSIFDAEVTITTKSIEEALLFPTIRFSSDIWLLIDYQEVARNLLRTPVCSSQKLFKSTRPYHYLGRLASDCHILVRVKSKYIECPDIRAL